MPTVNLSDLLSSTNFQGYTGSGGPSGYTGSAAPGFFGSAGGSSVAGGLHVSGTTYVSGNIVPTSNNTINLGTPTARFGTMYISANTIDIGGAQITSTTEGDIAFATSSGNVSLNSNTVSFLSGVSETGSAIGFTGSRGDLGYTGSIGYTGSQGVGFTGSQGIPGAAADKGYTGSQGDTGFAGSKGDLGFTGSQGIPGAAADKGYTGSRGDLGYTGSIGYTGSVGYTGSRGAYDAVGFTGSQGDTGFTGSKGDTGFTGSKGDTGFVGSRGDTGFTGSKGDLGYTGSKGDTGMGFAIAKTYASVAALTADTSPTGISAGQFAIIDTGNVNDAENSRLYLWTGSAYNYVNDLSGAVGLTGPAGSTGYTGSVGGTGSTGYTGSAGTGYTGSGSGTVSFVAAGTIPTGEVVVLKSDGTVSTAVETTAASFGTSSTIGTSSDYPAFKGVYDPVNQKVVIFYNNGSGMMIVGTVSGNTISFGTASSFTNFSTPGVLAAAYHASSGKIVTFFTAGNTIRYSIVTVSGTTATASTVTQYSASNSVVMDAVRNTASGNIVFVYHDLTNNLAKAVVVSTDGTTLTFGTEVTIATGSASGLSVANDANNNRVVVSRYSNSSAGTLYVGTVSGTSISFGTGVQYLSTGAGPTIVSYDPVNFQILVAYTKWSSGTIFYKIGTVSGTTITLGSEGSTGLTTRATYSDDFTVSYDTSTSKFVVGYRDDSDGGKPKVALITNNAGSITVGTSVYVGNSVGAVSGVHPIVSTGAKFVFGWRDASSTNLSYAVYVPGATTVQLNSNNYLGISAGTYQAGNTAIINSAGTVSNVSATGLTIGSVYYVSSVDGSLTTTPTSVVAGLAVGTNKILVKQKGDTGYAGGVGFVGSAGINGYTGSAGVGYTGSASTVIGYTGSQGAIGYTGSAGTGGGGGASNIPPNNQTSAYTLVISDVGKYINITTGGVTVPAGVFASGDIISIYNNSTSAQTITQGAGVTMYLVGTSGTGNRTLTQRGFATVMCVGTNEFVISGGGLT